MFDIRVTLSATTELLAVLDRFAAALHTVSALDKAARPTQPEQPKSPPFPPFPPIEPPAPPTAAVPQQETPVEEKPPATSKPAGRPSKPAPASPPAVAAPTVSEVRTAVAAAASKDRAAVVTILQKHGAKSVSALAEEHYAAVLDALKAIT